jgi:catechol 2,3-dioxygenase-like lactoylglutathione lyase family enzyme
MQLNHINLTVANIVSARELFTTYFDFTATDLKTNDTLSILQGKDGFTLVLMSNRMNQNGNNTYPDAFHIGFFLDSEAEVSAKHEQLKAGGVTIEQEPQKIRKSFGFYFHFQSIMIEIACQRSR